MSLGEPTSTTTTSRGVENQWPEQQTGRTPGGYHVTANCTVATIDGVTDKFIRVSTWHRKRGDYGTAFIPTDAIDDLVALLHSLKAELDTF